MKRLSLALAAVMVFALASGASAQILWDQSDFDAFGPGFFIAEAGGPPFGSTSDCVNHVTVPGNWNVNSISIFMTGTDPAFAELVSLIDVVTTNKTDFFREAAHFDFLTNIALPHLVKTYRCGLDRRESHDGQFRTGYFSESRTYRLCVHHRDTPGDCQHHAWRSVHGLSHGHIPV